MRTEKSLFLRQQPVIAFKYSILLTLIAMMYILFCLLMNDVRWRSFEFKLVSSMATLQEIHLKVDLFHSPNNTVDVSCIYRKSVKRSFTKHARTLFVLNYVTYTIFIRNVYYFYVTCILFIKHVYFFIWRAQIL